MYWPPKLFNNDRMLPNALKVEKWPKCERVQSETPLVRLATIVWLTLTSEPVKKRQRSWIDKEEWYLADLIHHWWEIWDRDVQDALPHAASLGDFERTMDESGHSCYRDFRAAGTDNQESLAAWLYVQLVLFPEHARTPVNLVYRSGWGTCGVCLKQWVFPVLWTNTNISPASQKKLGSKIGYTSWRQVVFQKTSWQS